MMLLFEFCKKNIKNNKGRSLLILFCIQLSAMLFFASCSTYRNMLEISYNQLKQECGNSDIVIKPASDKAESYLEKKEFAYSEGVDSIVYSIVASGRLHYGSDTINITMQGMDLEEYEEVYGQSLTKNYDGKMFTKDSIIVSKKSIEKYSLNKEQPIILEINQKKYEFQLFDAADLKGYFSESGQSHFAVISQERLREITGIREGYANTAYVRVNSTKSIENMIKNLSEKYEGSIVKEPFTQEEAKQETEAISIVLFAITLIVFVISIFIIYSAFKVIMQERMPSLAAFRSLGANFKQTVTISLAESLIYSLIGALAGCVTGVIAMTAVLYFTSNGTITVKETLLNTLNVWELLAAFFVSIIVTVVSSLLPVVSASKKSLISIIQHDLSINKRGKSKKALLIGALCTLTALGLTFLQPFEQNLLNVIVSIVLYLIGVIMLVPFITSGLGKTFDNFFHIIFGNLSHLAVTIFRNSKLVFSSVSLISIGIACVFTITILSNDVITEIVNSFITRNYDLMIEDETFKESMIKELENVEGVEDCYGVYEKHKVPVTNLGTEIWGIQGMDPDKYTDYWSFQSTYDPKLLLPKLNESRSIILTNTLKDKYGLNEGDFISLEFKNGVKEYEIIGFFDSILFLGNYALMSNHFMQEDNSMDNYYRVYVKSSHDAETVKKAIQDKFSSKNPNVIIMQELKNDFLKMYSQFFLILKVFAVIASLIGIFGVMNNTILCFMSREKIFSTLRSVGMEVSQIKKMLMIEALIVSTIGAIIGILSSLVLTKQVQNMLAAIHQPVSISYSGTELLVTCLIGMLVIVISYCIPIKRFTNLNIIESIKQY